MSYCVTNNTLCFPDLVFLFICQITTSSCAPPKYNGPILDALRCHECKRDACPEGDWGEEHCDAHVSIYCSSIYLKY